MTGALVCARGPIKTTARRPPSADLEGTATIVNDRFGSKADIGGLIGDVRFAPESGHVPRPNPRHNAAQAWDFRIL